MLTFLTFNYFYISATFTHMFPAHNRLAPSCCLDFLPAYPHTVSGNSLQDCFVIKNNPLHFPLHTTNRFVVCNGHFTHSYRFYKSILYTFFLWHLFICCGQHFTFTGLVLILFSPGRGYSFYSIQISEE